MRIAVLGTKGLPARHGAEIVVESIASRLVQRGHSVTVFGYDWYSDVNTSSAGINLVSMSGSRNHYFEMPSHMVNSVRHVLGCQYSFDVVHIHSVDPCLFALPLKKRLPIVASSHGRAYRLPGTGFAKRLLSMLAERVFFGISPIITCVSPADRDYYNSSGCMKIRYIPNGLPHIETRLDDIPSNLPILPNEYILFSAGRIIPCKGLDILLRAYSSLGPTIPLVIVGAPGGESTYFEQMQKMAPRNTIFAGFLGGSQLYSLYANAKVAVFPSRTEAQSITLLEYIALNVPFVFSDTPENMAVASGIGESFVSGDHTSLARILKNLLSRNGRASIPVDENRRRCIFEIHSWDSAVDEYEKCYTDAYRSFHS